jgi:hypothetical protein
MKTRCYNKNFTYYYNYGGRGIKICDEWLGKNGYKNFKNWALSNGYNENLTIERINNNGNYQPDNCKWITRKEQAYNQRTNVRINLNGKNQTVTEWANDYDLNRRTIAWRLKNNKSAIDLVKPARKANNQSNIKGITWHKKGYWQVNFKEKGVKKSKSFKSLDDAINFHNNIINE